MTSKADFNAADWSVLVDGPVYAALCVAAADRGGALSESMAMNRVYQDARAGQGANALLDEIVASPPAVDPRSLQGSDVTDVATEHLRRAMSILSVHATQQEVDAYKIFVMTVAQAVATAHKEGGFLGFGGTRVSDAENQALDAISIALGPPPAS